MKYVVEISSKQLSGIHELVNAGHYDGVQQFVEVAIENQLFLQKLPSDVYPEKLAPQKEKIYSNILSTRLPMPLKDPPFTDEPAEIQRKTLWGLYNRVFPAKIALRVLATLAAELEKPFVDFLRVREEASRRARLIGKLLADDDEKARRHHGEKLSTGLPIGSQDKAIARYQNMFVGFQTSKGKGGGLLVDLGFAVIKDDEKGCKVIALTEIGTRFAKLSSPILDVQNPITNVALSEEEADAYLNHIKELLPLEFSLYQKILDAISSGKNTPEELDLVVRTDLENLKKSVLATERAGMISRLTELGMLRRNRIGLSVSYSLTPRGEQFLKGVKEGNTGL